MDLTEAEDLRVQQTYARWLDWLVRMAFVLSVATFTLYVSGVLPPQVPLDALPELWRLPLAEYLVRTGAPTGWGWVALAGRGDYLNLVAIAFFALIALACYLRVIPLLPRLLGALAAAQVAVLLAAMSGLF
jgi:hypothetical protein